MHYAQNREVANMVERDPLDDYTDLLRAEASSSDEMLDASLQHVSVPEYLEQAANRYDDSRQRYETDCATRDGAARDQVTPA